MKCKVADHIGTHRAGSGCIRHRCGDRADHRERTVLRDAVVGPEAAVLTPWQPVRGSSCSRIGAVPPSSIARPVWCGRRCQAR